MLNANIFLNGITLEQLAEAVVNLLHQKKPQKDITKPELEEPQESVLLTRDEVCKLLNFNKTSLWKHTKSGKLKSYGIGNRVLYKRSEVLEAVKPINH